MRGPPPLSIPDGTRFGRWAVVYEVGKRGRQRYFLCRCDCGDEREVGLGRLRSGQSRSCGKCCRKGSKHAVGVCKNGGLFGEILAELLGRRHMSMTALARQTEQTPHAVANFVYAKSNPLPASIDRLAQGLEASERDTYRLHLAAARDRGYRI